MALDTLVIKLQMPCHPRRTVRLTTTPAVPREVFSRECPACFAWWQVDLQIIRQGAEHYIHRAEWTCTRGATMKEAQ